MATIKIMIGYMIANIVILAIFGLSLKIDGLLKEKMGKAWVEHTYILSFISLIIVLILKMFYNETFSFIGEKPIPSGQVILKMLIASFFAAILAYLAKPEQKNTPLKVEILTGMAMEIPMRLLVQNLFVVFGATAVLLPSITLSTILTAVIWVQFIVVQEIMMKKSLNAKILLDCMASLWFSIWVGAIYFATGSIIVAMITHGLERWVAYILRKRRADRIKLESRSC